MPYLRHICGSICFAIEFISAFVGLSVRYYVDDLLFTVVRTEIRYGTVMRSPVVKTAEGYIKPFGNSLRDRRLFRQRKFIEIGEVEFNRFFKVVYLNLRPGPTYRNSERQRSAVGVHKGGVFYEYVFYVVFYY